MATSKFHRYTIQIFYYFLCPKIMKLDILPKLLDVNYMETTSEIFKDYETSLVVY